MIAKVIDSGYSDKTGCPSSVLLPDFSKGFDKDVLHKQASVFEAEYDKFERKPKHTYIHLISVAAGEYYGHNSRADFYNGESYDHSFPKPEGVAAFRRLDGGIEKFHDTFMRDGACYTEHVNKHKKGIPQGYVVAAKYNKPMKRGELIIGVETEKWSDDIQRLSNGDPLKFSIGSDVAYDICSICGHIARSEKGHCDHYKKYRGQIDEDGNSVYVISDTGAYHDISRVRTPAERIAFSIKKVASGADYIDNYGVQLQTKATSAKYFLKSASANKRYDLLTKLAMIEKKIEAMASKNALDKNTLKMFKHRKEACGCSDAMKSLNKFISVAREGELLQELNKQKCVLTPADLLSVLAPNMPIEEPVQLINDDLELGVFNRLLEDDEVDVICESDGYRPAVNRDLSIMSAVRDIKPLRSVERDSLMDALINLPTSDSLTNGDKHIIVIVENSGKGLSPATKEYLDYFLSACDGLSDDELTSAVLQTIG